MRKGQINLLKKASDFSEEELEYLKEDVPIWILEERYLLIRAIRHYYGDGWQKRCVFAEIENELTKAANEYVSKYDMAFKYAFCYIRRVCCFPSFSMEFLNILKSQDYSIDKKMGIIKLMAYAEASYEDAEKYYSKSIQTNHPEIFLTIMILYDWENEKPLGNLSIKEVYAEYIANFSDSDIDILYGVNGSWLKYAIKNEIPLDVSVAANFSFDGYKCMQKNGFHG